MKQFSYTLLLFAGLHVCTGCHQRTEPDKSVRPVVQVTVVHPEFGVLENKASLSATTVYLKQNFVVAPVSGYIREAFVSFGRSVHSGQLLYTIETNERKAMGNLKDTLLNDNYGIIKVYATASGVINKLEKQQKGEYVLEGNLLCSVAGTGSLAFEIFCPYEYTQQIKKNSVCEITLPDSTRLNAQIGMPLTQVAAQNQAQAYLAKPDRIIALPESLIVAAHIITYRNVHAQLLPGSAVLSDELMHNFWVMKLINDTTAIKQKVVTGKKEAGKIEIISPKFSLDDRIVNQGNYGLADTAFVKLP
jgi:hypothetical protein